MVFKDPWILLFIPVVLIVLYFLARRQRPVNIRFSSKELAAGLPVSWKIRFRHLPAILRAIALALFLAALAGPRAVLKQTLHESEGIDIVLAIDASGSMAAEDFAIGGQRYNRLDVVKNVVREFIDHRSGDRIGLVTFAALAYTVCPLTTDYAWLTTNLERIRLGMITDGTAIGSAINSSLTRFKNSEAKSKVMILLTDGVNNAGEIDPLTAARAAQALGVKIYTIGAGTQGFAPFPVQDVFGRKVYQQVRIDIDEKLLQGIAQATGGKYFRATDTESLRTIYSAIDTLEKTRIEQAGYFEYDELFTRVLLAALMILVIELVLSNTLLLKIP
ncbi:MAG: VWA domain-containing protein [Candidatus Omnitrophica bacterium]|nr:VWA domain-containing protein [Candidatus Omnitrophota bacterium]